MKSKRSTQKPLRAKNSKQFSSAASSSLETRVGLTRKAQEGLDQQLTLQASKLLHRLGCDAIASRVLVTWNRRLQTTAGTACVKTGRVELNPRLLQIGRFQVQRTMLHEVAHLVAHARAGRRGIQTHGQEWKQACAELGIPGEPAFHDLPFERRRVERKYAYECPHCLVTVFRVRMFPRCTACYRCCKRFSEGNYDPRFKFIRVEF
jgi:predicted SprT family Zn-dependent metalloprotease